MARAFAYLLTLLYISTSVIAIPVEPRQLGGVGCNVARLKTVAGLRQTTNAVKKLTQSSDPAVADAATTAQGGLQSASDGIKTIAGALLTGQDAPADARDQVGQGLTTAQTALDGISTTDDTDAGLVSDAQSKLQKTISAGQDVVAKCGGGGGDAAAADANADDGSDAANANDGAGAADAADANDGTDAANANDGSDVANADDGSDAAAAAADDGSDVATADDGSDAADAANADDGAEAAAGDNVAAVAKGGRTSNKQQLVQPQRNNRIFGKRQVGNLQCNIARVQTVSRLAQSAAAVNRLKTAAASDPDAAAAAGQASTSLKSAGAAIGKIAAALVAGQKAPAAQRDITEKGLNDAMTALSGISSSDSAVTSAATAAMNKVASTIQAGQGVVNNCK